MTNQSDPSTTPSSEMALQGRDFHQPRSREVRLLLVSERSRGGLDAYGFNAADLDEWCQEVADDV